jgi:large subunit ribosomal protein L7/L12
MSTSAETAKVNSILNDIAQLSLMGTVELTKKMEEKFEVSAAVPVAMPIAASPGAAVDVVEEQTEFKILLKSFGEKKIQVIKTVRALKPGMGLTEAKNLVDRAPVVLLEGLTKEKAEEHKKTLEAPEVGATVEIQ